MKKEKDARKLLQKGKVAEALDKFNEAAHDYRHDGEYEKAIELSEECIKIAKEHRKPIEESLFERSLSEMHSQLGNRESFSRHILAFRKIAVACGSKSQEQLSYHVEAWGIQQLFSQGAADRTDIDTALSLAKKSRELIEQYKKSFKPSEPGATVPHRKAELFNLEAQLHNHLGNNEKALQLLEKAISLLTANDKNLRYDILTTKCSIVAVEKRVDIAELMDDDAPEEKKHLSLCELSHQYILAGRLTRGYKTLAQAVILHEKQFSPLELEESTKRFCIMYRLVKYSKIITNSKSESKISQCELYEAVGDLYDKYFQTLLPNEKKEYTTYIRTNILKNYERMLEYKRNCSDELRAHQAMALVYGDLADYANSKKHFEYRLNLLKDIGETQEKILDARVSIFNCMCKMGFSNLDKKFEELKEEVVRPDTKRELFECWMNYWTEKGNEQNAEKWREATESIPEVLIKNEDDETDVLFYRLSNDDILEKFREEEGDLLKLENMTEHHLHKTNDKGETILHQAAMKSNNEAVVEKLCKLKCDVNAKDNGGWTPLSEAVTHNEFGNVQVLIRYNADVNTRSTQSFVSEESHSSSDEQNHNGVTPLMDACANGFIDIAKLLIDNKARVDFKDSAKWTAYHHLKRYMDDHGADEKMIKFAEYLKNLTVNSRAIADASFPIHTLKNTTVIEDSPPDEEENALILGKAASRKRRNSNNSETLGVYSKRKQKSGEYIRRSPSPVVLPASTSSRPKRAIEQSMLSFCEPKRIQRQKSSQSLTTDRLNSLSPRRSISPNFSVRSTPSVHGGDDEIQVVGVRRKSDEKADQLPSSRILKPITMQRSVPTSRQQMNSDIVVKFCFDFSNGCVSGEIRPKRDPMKRAASIEEIKRYVKSINPIFSELKITNVWDQNDEDKCELGDELLLSSITDPSQPEIVLVFRLSAPPAQEIYQEISKNPIEEVTNRLAQLSTEKQLDLSALFLNSSQFSEMMRAFKKCDKPQNSKIILDFCELSTEDESNLQCLLEESSELTISNLQSKTGLLGVFEKTKNRLVNLGIIGMNFPGETRINKILKSCPNLKSLNLSSIILSSNALTDSTFPIAINNLKNLVKLDLSSNSSWISDQSWRRILDGSKNLEELAMNDTNSEVHFEAQWLQKLSSFSARNSDLHWDSIFELFSILESLTLVDVRCSLIDPSLPEELKKGKQMTEVLH